MRVLLIAEACNPEWVSVPLVGWSHAQALRQIADVHLVTQVRNAEAVERAGLIRGQDFTAINSETIAGPAHKLASLLRGGAGKGWTTLSAITALTYPYFERLIWKQFGGRIKAGEFDVVHRLIPLSPTTNSSLARKCRRAGVPYVIGPLNGGVPWPRQFDSARRQEKEWLSYVRGMYRLLPGYRATRKNSAAILIASGDTWRQMPSRYYDKCFYIPENAIDPAKFIAPPQRSEPSRPLHVVFVGRLVPYKGADMLLEAAAPLVREKLVQVSIIGSGPQMDQLKEFVQREQLETGVELAGWVEHSVIGARLAEADVFAFPSIREFGGAVAMEAMAVGAVPVVVNYGGPGELVTPATGYLIDMGSRQQIIERFRAVLRDIAEHPEQLADKSALGIRRAREQFTWDAKAAQVMQVYEWVARRRGKPNFPMPAPDPQLV
jgi:glycosyltransferase involved in cell wall biosynthesis